MSLKTVNKKRTLCEVLREINDLCVDAVADRSLDLAENRKLLKGIQRRVVEAEQMGKRMAHKLYSYNKEFDKGWWEENKDWAEDELRRMSK